MSNIGKSKYIEIVKSQMQETTHNMNIDNLVILFFNIMKLLTYYGDYDVEQAKKKNKFTKVEDMPE